MARCIDCVHQNQIDWNRGITDLSGYCPEGDRYIGKHVNRHGVNQSLQAQRKCPAFKPKAEPTCQEEASS
jgi:hypothetical protein